MAFGYALTSKGMNIMLDRATAKGLIPRQVWGVAEIYDLYKDI